MSIATPDALDDCAIGLSEYLVHFTDRHFHRGGVREIILRAADLRCAERQRRRLLVDASGDVPLVMLRIEAVVADTFGDARARWAQCSGASVSVAPTVRYVGTPLGLAGLVADVAAADVADGVLIVALPVSDSPTLIATQTVPWLNEHNLNQTRDGERGPGGRARL